MSSCQNNKYICMGGKVDTVKHSTVKNVSLLSALLGKGLVTGAGMYTKILNCSSTMTQSITTVTWR